MSRGHEYIEEFKEYVITNFCKEDTYTYSVKEIVIKLEVYGNNEYKILDILDDYTDFLSYNVRIATEDEDRYTLEMHSRKKDYGGLIRIKTALDYIEYKIVYTLKIKCDIQKEEVKKWLLQTLARLSEVMLIEADALLKVKKVKIKKRDL